MAQTTTQPEPDFVTTLKADIHGVYYSQAEAFSNETIIREFRKAVQDHALLADEGFMDNLMFLVRKKEVSELADDAAEVLRKGSLKPVAEASAMKTVHALGGDQERQEVDVRLSKQLKRDLRDIAGISTSPHLAAADGVGLKQTLEVINGGLTEAVKQQREAERATPDDHVLIGRLDQGRSLLETKAFVLTRKLEALAQDDVQRATLMAEFYLKPTRHLDAWAYKELVRNPSADTIDAVRKFVSQRLSTLIPSGLKDKERTNLRLQAQLRGVCLLETMRATLTEVEQKLLVEHEEMLNQQTRFFRPAFDWEDVLDRD
ncbi:MAG: hypothetical protein ACE5E5_07720 [Phycisphaerae bacterium]